MFITFKQLLRLGLQLFVFEEFVLMFTRGALTRNLTEHVHD